MGNISRREELPKPEKMHANIGISVEFCVTKFFLFFVFTRQGESLQKWEIGRVCEGNNNLDK